MKKSFYYKVVRLMVTAFETTLEDERHFPDVKSAREYARQTPEGLTAFIFRMNRDSVILL